MRIIDESLIPSGDAAYFKQGTWTHLQKAYKEAIDALAKAIIKDYDPTKVYILYGCVATGTDPGVRTFTAGAVYFNGEVYLVPSASFTSSGSNVALGNISVANNLSDYSVDPQITPGGVSISIHKIRTIVITAGTSGSGDVDDFADWLPCGVAHNDEYEDISSSIVVSGSLTSVTKFARRYFNGDVLVRVNATLSSNIASGDLLISNLPIGSGASYFPLFATNAGAPRDMKVVALQGSEVYANTAISTSSYTAVALYMLYKKEV